MRTVYILESSKKDAVIYAKSKYINTVYIGVYKRCGKGNTFYEFTVDN